MSDTSHIPAVLGEGKAYLNGKEYDLSEFYASGLGDPLTEATNSDTVTPVVDAAGRKLMPGECISGEVREAFMQAVSRAGVKAHQKDA